MTWAMSLVGLGLVSGGWLHYLWLIPQERVPVRPIRHLFVISLGLLLALLGAATGRSGLNLALTVAAAGLAGLFYYLLTIAALPPTKLTVQVGQPWPAFTALDDAGQAISSQVWQGQRVLLKFFRGQW